MALSLSLPTAATVVQVYLACAAVAAGGTHGIERLSQSLSPVGDELMRR